MKLNYRDKMILTVVCILAVWILGIWFFIIPAFQSYSDKNDTLTQQQVTLDDLQNQIAQDKNLNQRISDAYNDATQVANNFYDYQATQEATNTVDGLLDADDLENTSMTISKYQVKTIVPYTFQSEQAFTDFDVKVDEYENADSTAASENGDAAATTTNTAIKTEDSKIGYFTITVELNGTYNNIKSFCDKLTTNTQKSMVLSSLSITDMQDNDVVKANMTLEMMVLRKLPAPTN